MIQIGTYTELLSSKLFVDLIEDINQHQLEKKVEYDQESVSLRKQSSKIDPEIEAEESLASLPTNIETKQEGTVKWNVYVSYLRAGIGLIPGIFIILIIFSVQQAISIFSIWWIAEWSDDESYRDAVFQNCTNKIDIQTNRIHSMNETQWKKHQNERFYTYCCKLTISISFQ